MLKNEFAIKKQVRSTCHNNGAVIVDREIYPHPCTPLTPS